LVARPIEKETDEKLMPENPFEAKLIGSVAQRTPSHFPIAGILLTDNSLKFVSVIPFPVVNSPVF